MTKASERAAAKRLEGRVAFLGRRPLPVIVASVDSGTRAGFGIVAPFGDAGEAVLIEQAAVDTASRELEACLARAVVLAKRHDMMLFLALEEWGRGGPLGIDQWIGLGERRGPWKREFALLAAEPESPIRRTDSMVQVNARTWRSRMIAETGERVSDTFRPFDTDGWKRAATRTLAAISPLIIESADSAEASLLGLYAIRSDELLKKVPIRYLKRRGFAAW